MKTNKHRDQRIGKYVFSDTTVLKMSKLIEKTQDTDKEHGFTLCLDEKTSKIYPGQEHSQSSHSEERYIKFQSECRERGKKPVGTFHSHVTTSSDEPSALDIFSNCHEQNDVSCIGSPKDGKVTCMIKNNPGTNCQHKAKQFVDIENILIEKNEGDEEELYLNVDKVINENFRKEELKLK
ncbi:MAG: Mov34/MPN/PAD-1 family protein [Candidatus Dojkabacteria bacterium]|nr:Mov34/MPN/PAD-1 family protein [Candidatus Dojkabacteria bacterium]